MLGSILVAVDGSSHSMKAVEIAAQIAAGCSAKLQIVTVIREQDTPKLSPELQSYAKLEHIGLADFGAAKLISNDLLTHAKEVAEKAGAENTSTEVITGPVARTIVAYAKRKKADMIVVGSRGLGNVEATLRGGVSHRVELLAECSVLTVK
ncbi:MAG: universal stress protein [Rhizobiaceae bacterium]